MPQQLRNNRIDLILVRMMNTLLAFMCAAVGAFAIVGMKYVGHGPNSSVDGMFHSSPPAIWMGIALILLGVSPLGIWFEKPTAGAIWGVIFFALASICLLLSHAYWRNGNGNMADRP